MGVALAALRFHVNAKTISMTHQGIEPHSCKPGVPLPVSSAFCGYIKGKAKHALASTYE